MKKTLQKIFAIIAKTLTVLLTMLSLVLFVISFARPDLIKSAIGWIGELITTLGNWNYLIAFASACIESLPIIGTAVPGMNIMILVGGFWGKMHIILTILCASLGAMLGNYLGYWIGKWYGHEIIEKYGDYIGLGRTEQKILSKQIEKNGFWYITLGKFHNFTRAFVPFIAGASGMKEQKFWIYNTIGSIIWAISINLLGIFFIDRYEMILDNLGKITLVILGLVFAYFYFFKRDSLKTYMRDKQMEIEDKIKQK
ncbi:DedA family protein [Candidatus Gracilibacteria bacterium]|nr:DedA family protein [Candidatus Gracilibacteria bacterium]